MAGAVDSGAIKAILCDADGCLFPSEGPAFDASAAVTNRFLAEIGATARFSPEELRLATTGKNFRTTAAALAREEGLSVDSTALERWVETEREQVSAHLTHNLRPDPRVIDPLARLARDRILAVVSSSAITRVEACLAAVGLDGFFPERARFSAESSLPQPLSKPDPAVYVLAGDRLGISSSEGLAVEDSLPGAQAAIAAGFPTFGNMMFVPAQERPARIVALERAGVAGIVFSWSELERVLATGEPAGRQAAGV
ncbi:MAG: HAD-superfamily hydrolase, subfamily variant 3 [Solirubrobacterales bacterium]|nr:HAD-superfamily hydrolase, subfamily variant 3 [Solirubrobacterales bacterium]